LVDVLLIGLIEKFFERVELILPEDAVEGEPVGGLLHGRDGETAHADATYFLLGDEASLLEYAEVLHDGGHRDLVWANEFGDRGLAALESGQDAATRWVAECGEGGVERLLILNHTVK
jgi:hypothetical protein